MRMLVLTVITVWLAAVGPAAAQDYIGSYSAWIGWQDLYNSRGQRLTEPWQVIRQDRANFHRFNRRDPGDGGDPWFANAAMRGQLEQAIMAAGMAPWVRQMVLNGGVPIRVDLYGCGSGIARADVQIGAQEFGKK